MSIRPPSLRSVAAFEAAARHESFSKAAAELSLTDSAISHGIHGLEERLGQRLFRRKGRRVVLTPAGRTLADRIGQGLTLLNAAFQTWPDAARVHLVLAAPTCFARVFLTPGLAGFFEGHAGFEIELRGASDLRGVQDGEADMAVLYGAGPWPGVSARFLLGETLCPATGGGYRAAAGDLARADLLEDAASPWRRYLSKVEAGGGEPRCRLASDDYALLEAAACEGLGVVLARTVTSAAALRDGRLVRLGEREIQSDEAYWLVWNEASTHRAAIAAFGDWLTGRMPGQAGRDILQAAS